MDWIKTKEHKPDEDSHVEISDDGLNIRESALFKKDRVCMLAGLSAASGRFGSAGFATDGSTGCETNLILDDPEFWRYSDCG